MNLKKIKYVIGNIKVKILYTYTKLLLFGSFKNVFTNTMELKKL